MGIQDDCVFCKEARGLMARYIIDTNAKTIDDLKGFNYDGIITVNPCPPKRIGFY